MMRKHRRHPRVATVLAIHLLQESLDRRIQTYWEGVVENCSLSGMFISSETVFPEGSVITIQFSLESETIRARVVVRWTQRSLQHSGMGVEFIIFDGIGYHEFRRWVKRLVE